MVYKKNFKTRISQAPNYHKLFREKYVKSHLIGDDRWTPHALTNQYKCMADILTKHNNLSKLEFSIKQKKQKKKVINLKDEIIKCRDKLKESGYANNQKLGNVLQDHKKILHLCQMFPMDRVIENINQKLFIKQKESDRLKFKIKQLSKEYENKLQTILELEDRIKFKEEFSLPEESKIKKLQMELTNTQTRLKAIKVIKRSYIDIIQFLMQDAIYYESVLDALQKDIEEQENFIDHVLHLGLPATTKLPILREKYKIIENKRNEKIKVRIEQLRKYRKNIMAERDVVLKQLQEGIVVDYDLVLYARETQSIIELKSDLYEIQMVFKKLKNATHTSQIKDVVRVMKTQIENNAKLRSIINLYEKEKHLLEQKELVARQVQETLNFSYTKEEIERIREIEDLRDMITKEKKTQSDISEQIKQNNKVFVLLSWAINHIVNTLRNIGYKIPHPHERSYPVEELKLPLLNFDMYNQRSTPPLPHETNLEKLLEAAKDKVIILANMYNQLPEAIIQNAEKIFDVQFKNNFNPKILKKKPKEEQTAIFEEDERHDGDVPTREKIKNESAKIVDEHLKKED